MVRAKFKVTGKTAGTDGTATISLAPVFGDSPENKEFFRYTPSGSISLGIVNPAAAEQFREGAEYYVNFTPAD